ncbi:GerMN domain-containing protein [Bacillus solimangrovi]|uniref:Sporulation protein n=1 Tax=Bacillus solimangrovi TaxID=1305675 RepID=A0A1E5LCZ0_9BACI|nr:GerMN domain-containing protein [Bacillus solimangrovi]OEH91945.1 sporulation protein [Bacillus solimangrovi]
MPTFNKIGVGIIGAAFVLLLSGCGFFQGERASQQVEQPNDATYVEEGMLSEGPEENGEIIEVDQQNVEMVQRELYLIDQNGYVVPQMLQLPKTKEVAKQALEYLVQNGPIMEELPNGFRAVLPAGTQVLGLNMEEGTLVADFSTEFTEYAPEDEQRIVQSLTWTLTQFDNIDRVQIRINGHEQPYMPVNGTPINDGLSRADGINFDHGDVVDVQNSKAMTLYFLAQNGEDMYYVPITRRVEKANNNVEAVVAELIEGPAYDSKLLSEFHPDLSLVEKPKNDEGTVTLNFNEVLLGSLQGTAVSEHLLKSLVLSLTEQEGIEQVALQVNGDSLLHNNEGEEISEPVSRPEAVNTGSF